MTTGAQLAEFYRDGRARLSATIAALTDDELAMPVPGCPGWTVKDTFAHLVANPIDGLAGKISGPPSEEQTAEQVARFADSSVAELIEAWEGASAIDGVIEAVGVDIAPIVIDLHIHEQDILGALGRVESRDLPAGAWIANRMRERLGIPVPADDFELSRAMLGRRSHAQVAAWPWADGMPADFFIFGPRPDALVE